jgi:hypothetical protein
MYLRQNCLNSTVLQPRREGERERERDYRKFFELNDIATQKTVLFIVTVDRTSN